VPLDPKRKGDLKVIAGATVAVLLVGFFIFGAMMMTTGGGSGPTCGRLNIGLATGVRKNLEHGPYFQTGGGRCGFYLALENDNIVAYKVEQPSGCTLLRKFDHWECDKHRISAQRLSQYPVSIQTVEGVDRVLVNLRSPAAGSTTTVATSTTVKSTPLTSVPATSTTVRSAVR